MRLPRILNQCHPIPGFVYGQARFAEDVQASRAIQRMQRTLVEMNIQPSTVLSDLSGVSGMAILEAILAAQRDPKRLAKLADLQVKASKAETAKSLQGNWRPELLFILSQEVDVHRGCQQRMGACDRQRQQQLRQMASVVDVKQHPIGRRSKGKRARGNAPRFDLRSGSYRLTGIDWTQIDGFDVQVAQTLISEVGTRLDAFPSEKHFANWLGLCLTNENSGGKGLKRRTPKAVNRARVAFRHAATSLFRSQSYLEAQIPAFAGSTRQSQSHHCHGAQAGLFVLPTDDQGEIIHRPRSRILRVPLPRTTDQRAHAQGLPVRTPSP